MADSLRSMRTHSLRIIPRRGIQALVLGLGLCLALSSVASAASIRLLRDRADNGFYFSYDGQAGQVTQAGSSLLITRGSSDPVRFITSVQADPAAPQGRRVTGIIRLALNGDRRVVYDGTFRFKVVGDGFTVVRKVTKRVVLSPDHRRARVGFSFDLPSGDYSVEGRYAAAS